jgi:cobaltochelatase CobT
VSKDTTSNFKELTTSTFKAMSGQNIDVTYAGDIAAQTHEQNYTNAILPNLDIAQTREKQLLRGAADMKALRIRHHNTKIHTQNAPKNTEARSIYNALEQARCEALGEKYMHGVHENLNILLDEKSRTLGYEDAQDRQDVKASDAIHALGRSAFTNKDIPHAMQNAGDLWADYVDRILGEDGFSNLTSNLQDQQQFAKQAKILSENLAYGKTQNNELGQDEKADEDDTPPSGEEDQEDSNETGSSEDEDSESTPSGSADDDASGKGGEGENIWDFFQEDGEHSADDMMGEAPSGDQLTRPPDYSEWHHGNKPYFVYTSQFDEEVKAEKLADLTELSELKEKLDSQLIPLQATVRRLAHKLQRKLMAQQQRFWAFNQEEGILDTKRLSRIIADPNIELTYKREIETPFKDTVVTLLIDNSGSMRGRPITIAAICTDILVRTLEKCGVRVEVLGFTTSTWKGGKSRELWIQNARPANPGRLNDLRHIIYKAADASWRKTQKNIGLMLKEGLLKENIDGEALAWAHNRLARRGENRKILIVISDGAPVDDSTLSANPANILEQDLRAVIKNIEERSSVELCAIGIGHDVTRYYQNSMKVSDADGLAAALTGNLENLFHLQ